jgi:hypothetical protein
MQSQAQKDSQPEWLSRKSPPTTHSGWRSSTSLERLRELLLRKSLHHHQLKFLRKAGFKSHLKK